MFLRGAGIGAVVRLRIRLRTSERSGSGARFDPVLGVASVVVTLVSSTVLAACAGSDDASLIVTNGMTTVDVVTAPPPTSESVVAPVDVPDEVPDDQSAGTTVVVGSAPASSPQASAPEATVEPAAGALGPPRVEFVDDPERQAVVDAAYAFFDAARAAQADPDDEDLRDALAATMTEPIAERMTAFLDGLVLDGVRIIANPDSPTYLQVFVPSVSQADGSGLVDVCAVDSDVRVDSTTGAVLDDDIVSSLQTYFIQFENGSWRVRDFVVSQIKEGEIGCD
ncbi:MAG: hypothetical protein ACO3D0_00685 [Ilumatobacteraceae bacterium]